MSTPYALTYVMGQLVYQLPSSAIDSTTDLITSQTTRQGHLNIWMPPPPLILDLRWNPDLPSPAKPRTHHDSQWLAKNFARIEGLFDGVNHSIENAKERRLSSQQIQQIKQTNPLHPSVMIFIHGYNVGQGSYGQQLFTREAFGSTANQVHYQGDSQPIPHPAALYFVDRPATIYRDPGYYPKPLNGSADHNWWLCMEYQLNCAAGFDGFQSTYQSTNPQYTRILNVAWSGDPVSPLDYMAVEPMAAMTAMALVPTIEQLSAAGIEINIIAHSAGNIVLLQLMTLLGQHHLTNLINHAFMWQPAMPNNVLSPHANAQDDSLTNFWQTGVAYTSTKQITVLYSHHDNVLGPIPVSIDGKHHSEIVNKWRSSSDGPGMTSMALAVDMLDQQLSVPNALKSCYHVAHLFHVPFNVLLFDQSCRDALYQSLYKHHRTVTMQLSLQSQVSAVKHEMPQAFNDLALFLSLYAAIKHDGIMEFLLSAHNTGKLAQLAYHLAPQEIAQLNQNVSHALAVSIDHEERQRVYIALVQSARRRLSFAYLKSLWQQLEFSAYEFYQWSKAVDFLLHYRYLFLMKEPQITFKIWQSLRQHYQAPHHPLGIMDRSRLIAKRGEEVAALVITVLNTPGIEPRPAMGYSGLDITDPAMRALIKQGRIRQVDQSQWLFHHSAMRPVNTNSLLFKHVYQDAIMHASNMHFGDWKRGRVS